MRSRSSQTWNLGEQREGFFDSQYAPPMGESDYIMNQEIGKGREKGEATRAKQLNRRARVAARKEKGKNKEVVGVTRENPVSEQQPTAILK
jgi:hypothetical protein